MNFQTSSRKLSNKHYSSNSLRHGGFNSQPDSNEKTQKIRQTTKVKKTNDQIEIQKKQSLESKKKVIHYDEILEDISNLCDEDDHSFFDKKLSLTSVKKFHKAVHNSSDQMKYLDLYSRYQNKANIRQQIDVKQKRELIRKLSPSKMQRRESTDKSPLREGSKSPSVQKEYDNQQIMNQLSE